MTNLEAQAPYSEIAEDIQIPARGTGTLRVKKQRALEAAEKEIAQASRS